MGEPAVAAVRRWAVDWLGGRHPQACQEVLSPGYTLRIGGFLLGPRSAYVPATLAQLSRYPGLVVTVHHLATDGEHVAVCFSEHGASARLGGRAAVWPGVALFDWDGAALTGCFAEEDYYARRRQLDSGTCDLVEPPAAAPWDQRRQPANPAAEAAVLAWLAGPDPRAVPVVCDDEPQGQPAERLLEVSACRVHRLFSAGEEVAFHAAQTGRYLGGLGGLDELVGATLVVEMAGLVTVRDQAVVGGRVVRDRLGAARALRERAGAAGMPLGS